MAFFATGIIREVAPPIPLAYSTPDVGIPVAIAVLPPRYGLRELAFDGLISVAHDTSISLTSYPAEVGADLFDHTYDNPNTIRIVGGVSLLADTRPLEAWALIQELKLSRRRVTISTSIGSYTNMILVRASTTEDNTTQGALLVSLDFKELLVSGGGPGFGILASGPARNRYSTQINRGFVEATAIDFGLFDIGFET